MLWELDHVFLACPDETAAREGFRGSGIALEEGRVHRGQGTRNLCAYFDNAYFEVLLDRRRIPAPPRKSANAGRTLTHVTMHHPPQHRLSPGVQWFAESSPLSFVPGPGFRLELRFALEDRDTEIRVDLRGPGGLHVTGAS